MKILFRADDLGFSEAVNLGILKSILDGPIRNVGLMPGMDAAEHGFKLIKNLDIALGQHTNISVGKPLSDPKRIPSLVSEEGFFHNSKTINGRKVDTIDIGEAEIEIEAQLSRFKAICGKMPDYFEGHAVFSKNYFTALKNVAEHNGLFYCNPFDKAWLDDNRITLGILAKLGEGGMYDPYHHILEDKAQVLNQDCALFVFHPGYIDQYLLNNSTFTLVRPKETEFLTSRRLKEWLVLNHIQIADFRTYRR